MGELVLSDHLGYKLRMNIGFWFRPSPGKDLTETLMIPDLICKSRELRVRQAGQILYHFEPPRSL